MVNTRPPDHGQRQLLRARKERPCGCLSGNPFDECASSHCRPQGQSRYGLSFGTTLLQRGFATGGERGQKSFCVALTAANSDWRLDFGGPSPSPLGRGRRVQCCRAQRRRFATGQREDCSAECGSPSLAGLESGVSQPSFWPLFSFSTARLMKSCMLRFAFAGNSNAM